MNLDNHHLTIHVLLGCAMLLLVSCADDAYVDFSDTENEEKIQAYAFCEDTSVFEADKQLERSDFIGAYVKTRELACGIVGCDEVPLMAVQYEGFSPELVFDADGTLSNANGPFERFETWTFRAADQTDAPHRFVLIDADRPDITYPVTLLQAGPCRIRLENGQGWIEYTRLEEL